MYELDLLGRLPGWRKILNESPGADFFAASFLVQFLMMMICQIQKLRKISITDISSYITSGFKCVYYTLYSP